MQSVVNMMLLKPVFYFIRVVVVFQSILFFSFFSKNTNFGARSIGINFDVFHHAIVCQRVEIFFFLAVATSVAAGFLWQGEMRSDLGTPRVIFSLQLQHIIVC